MNKNKNTQRVSKPVNPPDLKTSFKTAHGEIQYGMTNDYMFRAVLQSNNKVLRGLICSLLHLKESEVRSVEITNPIPLGKSITNKEIRLDINVTLNNNTFINLEMQVSNELNWPERSITYLCRSVDQLNHGEDYINLKPVIHIGFLDYTLFKEYPEFYATYKLINVNNHHVYSDKMTLSVVNLSRIDLATEEDKAHNIDKWASLFKAKTWEELKMISANNEYLNEASETIYNMNSDYWVRKISQDSIEHQQDIRNYQRSNEEKDRIIAEKDEVIAEMDGVIAQKDEALTEKDFTIKQLTAELERLKNHK
ncbi:MAG: Rpn family recombination-promoting nuclease/putative transposase [Lachnospiraceae bacterium]|nr:Rpn family recombination-promoting nuclease/putative transposase [Lachnospiraceae bacterium]